VTAPRKTNGAEHRAEGPVHEAVEASLRRAIEQYYRLGQILSAPQLLDHPDVAAMTVTGRRLPAPGEAGFDPWARTDPASRPTWEQTPPPARPSKICGATTPTRPRRSPSKPRSTPPSKPAPRSQA
jgi:hypothetical protein